MIAVFLTGGLLNVATMVGFITLFGIAVRNGILFVSHYDTLLDEGKVPRDPLALGGSEPGKEIRAPMAIVVLGGLLTSTALNMVVVPALFLRYGEHREREIAA